ncbi:MAG TPA: hypothetical protein GX523_13950 [Desulfitobacterium dehalogenans]|uniref:Uncharacterized protein n=1 Tax=Desulfitobacterium dehalogenans TaxID=36854 RepID=A0A7C7DB42_9FIRM|nr:hypothetical protein [Desulfitobacterium dehalogenans]
MNKLRRISSMICIMLLVFILSGCADRPFLTKDGMYSIVSISSDQTVQKTPIQLTWNSNIAVMQKLLVEASFVLGDLHSIPGLESGEVIVQDDLGLSPPKHLEASLVPSGEGTFIPINAFEPAKDLIEAKEDGKTARSVIHDESMNENLSSLLGESTETILLEATFPEMKPFALLIDNEIKTLNITSIQIEVIGKYPGRVLLNQNIILQGIPNPNLQSAFIEFLKMQQKTEQTPGNG